MKSMLDYRRVTFSDNKIKDFNACDEFFKLTVTSYVVTGVVELLNMNELKDQPNSSLIQDTGIYDDDDTRRDTLYLISSTMVKKYVSLDYQSTITCTEDKKRDYARLLISIGLLYLEYYDAIKEGTGHGCSDARGICFCSLSLQVEQTMQLSVLIC